MDMRRQQLLDSEPLKVAKAQAQVTRLYNEYTRAPRPSSACAHPRPARTARARAEHVAAVAGARAKLLLLKAQLEALGAHPPVEIKVDTDIDRGRIKRRVFLLKESMKGILDKVGSLGDLTARIGPFTASIKQIGLALAVLGPTITDLVGGAGALVGVLGTGIAGAAGVGAAALLGFGQAGLGVFAALKPVIDDYKSLNTLTKALSTAQLKHGEGSKQAGHAQGQLNRALRQVDPVTRQAFQGIAKLRTEWHKATDEQARKSFGHVVAEGVKTASVAAAAVRRADQQDPRRPRQGHLEVDAGLRSAEGMNILDTTFSNANRSLGPLMSGVGSLATMIGRIAASASKLLPSLSQGFAKWAQGRRRRQQRRARGRRDAAARPPHAGPRPLGHVARPPPRHRVQRRRGRGRQDGPAHDGRSTAGTLTSRATAARACATSSTAPSRAPRRWPPRSPR